MRIQSAVKNADDLLKRVSRSFYMTLRVLPRAIRPQLSLAYLLARATDTVADTDAIAVDKRQAVLSEMRRCIQAACAGQKTSIPDLAEFLPANCSGFSAKAAKYAKADAELTLLENFETLLNALHKFSDSDRKEIRVVLETIIRGQQADIRRFGMAPGIRLNALATDKELDAYTYEVAGCVGKFWTRLCLAHVFPHTASSKNPRERGRLARILLKNAGEMPAHPAKNGVFRACRKPLDEKRLMSDAVRFGKGLQFVNILRDLPEDLRQGRCYIPEQSLLRFGLKPDDLLNHAANNAMNRFRPLYEGYLKLAEEHLRAGWRYTASLPFSCARVRFACAWPILIGIKTLGLLRGGNILADPRVKITRRDIRGILIKSVLLYPCRKAWDRLFEKFIPV